MFLSRYYEDKWVNAIHSLKDVLRLEKNETDQEIIQMYLQYTIILSDLDKVYGGISGPQKRQSILRTMSLIIARIVDLKNTHQIQVRDYHSSMRDIKTPVPSFFREKEETTLASRNLFIEECFRCKVSHESKGMCPDVAPQIDEEYEAKEYLSCNFIKNLSKADLEARAIMIQRYFRGYLARLYMYNKKRETHQLIGMESFNNDDSENYLRKKLLEYTERLNDERINNETEYKGALRVLKDELRKEEGLKIRQIIRDERIEWATNVMASTNNIPDIADFYTRNQNEKISQSECIITAITEDVERFQNFWLHNIHSPQIYSELLAKDTVLRKELVEELRISEDEILQRNLERMRNITTSSTKKKSKADVESKPKEKSGNSKSKKLKGLLPGDKIEGLKDLKSHQMLKLLVEENMIHLPKDENLDGFISHPHDLDGMSSSSPSGNLSEAKRLLTEHCILPNISKEIKEMLEENHMIRSVLIHGSKGIGKFSAVRAIAGEIGAMIIELNPNHIPESYRNDTDGIIKLVHMIFSVAKDPSFQPAIIYLANCEQFFHPMKKTSSETIFSKIQKALLMYKNQEITKDRVLVVGCTSMPWEIDPKVLQWKGESGKPEKQGFFERIVHLPMPGYIERGLMWDRFIRLALKCHGLSSIPIQIDSNLLSRESTGYSGGQILKSVNKVFSSPEAIRNTAKFPQIKIEATLISALKGDKEMKYQQEDFDKFNRSLTSISKNSTPQIAQRKIKK